VSGIDAGGEEAARLICLRLLAAAPRTRAQLAKELRRRKVPQEISESVLGRFAEVGLIDDAAFARAWVESRHHGRGLARQALAAELRQRGVPAENVKDAVSALDPRDELATARRLVAKKLAASRGKPMPARIRQLAGMLARKGYPARLVFQVVREALEQEGDDGSDWRADLASLEDAAADADSGVAADADPAVGAEAGPAVS
jgi:regulatory protein